MKKLSRQQAIIQRHIADGKVWRYPNGKWVTPGRPDNENRSVRVLIRNGYAIELQAGPVVRAAMTKAGLEALAAAEDDYAGHCPSCRCAREP